MSEFDYRICVVLLLSSIVALLMVIAYNQPSPVVLRFNSENKDHRTRDNGISCDPPPDAGISAPASSKPFKQEED